jgi:hypothetical protein
MHQILDASSQKQSHSTMFYKDSQIRSSCDNFKEYGEKGEVVKEFKRDVSKS